MVEAAASVGSNKEAAKAVGNLISGESGNSWVPIDCGMAAENITLAAESLGIGSCIMTSSGFLLSSEFHS
jgi:nitroreductase